VRGDVLDEQPGRHPLAGQSALHVAERDDDGVDVASGHQRFELGLRQHASHAEKSTIGNRLTPA
jgi:hypothetical protein